MDCREHDHRNCEDRPDDKGYEINPATGAVINTRSTTFTMPSVAITNVVLVKYIGMNFADSLTFILSNNLITYSLVEANAPSIAMTGGQIWTSRTSANAQQWNSVCWSPTLSLFCAVSFKWCRWCPDYDFPGWNSLDTKNECQCSGLGICMLVSCP